MSDRITCPKCSHAFVPTEEMSKKIRAELDGEYSGKMEKLERDFQAKLKSEAGAAQRVGYAKAEEEIGRRQSELEESLKETKGRLETAQQAEITLRKQQRELEQEKNEFQLRLTREMDSERSRIVEETSRTMSDKYAMKEEEWTKQRSDMLKQMDELRRKAEQGSQQAQGEVFELKIESVLKEVFTHDSIEPVAKGVTGGDILQVVNTKHGTRCGAILWELKRTKAFSDGWIQKLKDDQRDAKADVSVIVTSAMPKGVERIGQVDGVWVVEPQSMLGIALALRASIMEVAQARKSQAGRKEKAEEVYEYLNGVEFRGRVQSLVEAFVAMKEDLDAERRAIEKSWSKREKQLMRAIGTTAGMYGDLQGLVGSSLPDIKALSLEPA